MPGFKPGTELDSFETLYVLVEDSKAIEEKADFIQGFF